MGDHTEYENDTPNSEVLQDEDDPKAVPVEIRTPVQVREVPSLAAGFKMETVDAVSGIRFPADPRRKIVTLYAFDQEIRIGAQQSNVITTAGSNTANGARWPKLVPLVVTTCDEFWVASSTSVTELTVIIENWAL
jgi:hypothetical protein